MNRRAVGSRADRLPLSAATIALAAILLLALVVKLAYLHERRAQPDFLHPTMDALVHDQWANALATGRWEGEIAAFRDAPYYRAPLYPYVVAGIYRAFGRDYDAVLTIQALLGVLCIAALARIAKRLYGKGAAFAAALLALGYWPLTYSEGELLNPVLAVLLNLVFLLAFLRAAEDPRASRWILPGVVLGASALVVPVVLVVAAPVALWMLARSWPLRSRLRCAAVFVAATALSIAPVTIRNLAVGHDFVPIASSGGLNFYIGNNPESNGIRAVAPGTRADWWGGYHDAKRLAEESAGRALKSSEVSSYWLHRGLGFWREEPGTAARLFARKLALAAGNAETSNNRQEYFRREQSGVLRALFVNFALIMSLAAAGLASAVTRRRDAGPPSFGARLLPAALGVTYLVAVAAFFVTSRYRLPAVVFLIPLAGFGVDRLVAAARAQQWRAVAVPAALGLVAFFLTLQNPYAVGSLADSRGYYDLGVDFTHTDLPRALDSFDRSIAADTEYAPAWKMKGWTLEKLNRLDEALPVLREACRLDTTGTDNFFLLGKVAQKLGRDDEALRAYRTSTRLDPTQKYAWNNIADIYMRRGQVREALPFLQRALIVDPEFANSRFGMAYYYEQTGQPDSALAIYRDLRGFEPARVRLRQLEAKMEPDPHGR